jgi:hypothetical protein
VLKVVVVMSGFDTKFLSYMFVKSAQSAWASGKVCLKPAQYMNARAMCADAVPLNFIFVFLGTLSVSWLVSPQFCETAASCWFSSCFLLVA